MISDTEQPVESPVWRVEQIESLEHGFGAGIFDCADNEVVSMYASHGWLDAEIAANLTLMAAAPELLSALKQLVAVFDPDKQAIYEHGRAAIEQSKLAIHRATQLCGPQQQQN